MKFSFILLLVLRESMVMVDIKSIVVFSDSNSIGDR